MFYSIQGTLYLLGGNLPLNSDYEHSIDFENPTEQYEYFYHKKMFTCNNMTHMRKDTAVKVPYNIEALYCTNYVMYRNYTNTRWIYGFITDKRYINEGNTELTIETDVFQTYMFDYSWNQTFIDREHTERWAGVGVPVYSLTDEGLTLGDEYIKAHEEVIRSQSRYYLIIASNPLEGTSSIPNMVNSMPTPFYYYIAVNNENLISALATEPCIISIQALPFLTFDYQSLPDCQYNNLEYGAVTTIKRIDRNVDTHAVLGTVSKFAYMDLPDYFNVGVPRNYNNESKLLCFPYTYLQLTQYQSAPVILKMEYISGEDIEITLCQNIDHNIKSKYYISGMFGYKGDKYGKETSLISAQMNDMPLVTDVYKNYLQQNRTQIAASMVLSATEAAGGVVMAAASGGLSLPFTFGEGMAAARSIGMELAKQKDLNTMPNNVRQMGNNISFDIADGNMSIKIVRMEIHDDFRRRLGNYWAMYGYKSGEIKNPNTRSRYYYNYIKTIGANLNGNIENGHMVKLKGIFDKGITIWHHRPGVVPLNYSYDNVEMTLLPT